MANIYVRSTDGLDTDDGLTWSTAKATVGGAAAIDVAGDTIFLSNNHAESTTSMLCAWEGTNANPTKIIAALDTSEPSTTVSTATISLTGATSSFSWTGAVYTYGITFNITASASTVYTFNGLSGFTQLYENCNLMMTAATSSTTMGIGPTSTGGGGLTILNNCGFKLGHTSNRIRIAKEVEINGGSWLSGGVNPFGIFYLSGSNKATILRVNGFDFTNLSTTVNLVDTVLEGGALAIFRNCKLPTGWTGSLVTSGQMKNGTRVEMWNCDDSNTNYRLWIEDYSGSIKQNSTIYKTAFSGGTPHSLVMQTNANTSYVTSLVGPEFIKDNSTTGSSVTATVEIITDGLTLKDDECWLEVMYMDSASNPHGTWIRDNKATILTTAANQTTSAIAWNTTGMTSPTTQKLEVSFTPQKNGYVIARVVLAKASSVVYIDPEVTLA